MGVLIAVRVVAIIPPAITPPRGHPPASSSSIVAMTALESYVLAR